MWQLHQLALPETEKRRRRRVQNCAHRRARQTWLGLPSLNCSDSLPIVDSVNPSTGPGNAPRLRRLALASGELRPARLSAARLRLVAQHGVVAQQPDDDGALRQRLDLVGGLRRSMAKAGYCDLKEFQKVGLTVGS